jgi:hypothetical protein
MIDQGAEERLSRLLEELGPADPPAGFVRQVMARITRERYETTERVVPFNRGGIAMTRKIMWGLAAAAVAVLGVFAISGFPPVGRGTEGTIGAAKKYQAPQITDKDVVLGDVSAQQFLQSDTFARLLKDPASLKLLSDAHFVQQLNDPALASALKNLDLAAALSPGGGCHTCKFEFLAALQNPSFANAVQDPQFLSAVQSPAFVAALQSPQFLAALEDPAVAAALQKQDLQAASKNSVLAAALKNPAVAAALHPYGAGGCGACMKELFAALQSPSFARALRNPEVFAALQTPAFAQALSDARLGAALQSHAFQQALNSSGFFAALKDARFAQAMASSH